MQCATLVPLFSCIDFPIGFAAATGSSAEWKSVGRNRSRRIVGLRFCLCIRGFIVGVIIESLHSITVIFYSISIVISSTCIMIALSINWKIKLIFSHLFQESRFRVHLFYRLILVILIIYS